MKKITVLIIFLAIQLAGCATNEADNLPSNSTSSKDEAEFVSTSGIDLKAMDTSTAEEGSKAVATFVPDYEGIKEIMHLKKDEIYDRIGTDYKIVQAGAEGEVEGYYYEQYGITLIFDDFQAPDYVEKIECTEKVDIKGARLGMTFAEIQKVLGEKDIKHLTEPYSYYALIYEFDNFKVWFGIGEEEGSTEVLEIRRNYLMD